MDGMIKRNEIGSEFWSIPATDKETFALPPDTKEFISGSAALEYILRDIFYSVKPRNAALPSWCCSSMIEPFLRMGVECSFYSVTVDDGILTCDYDSAPPCDITLVISYFGYADQKTCGEPKGIIIRDVTHSVFSADKTDASYYFGSMRKWAGFWTGGYAWKRGEWETAEPVRQIDPAYTAIRKQAMDDKLLYLQGLRTDKSYLKLFEQAEEYLDHCDIMSGSQRDSEYLKRFDVRSVITKRRQNAAILLTALKEYAIFKTLDEDDCPLFVPIMIDKGRRDGLRKYLINNEIYCPVHWGVSRLHQLTKEQKVLYEQELSVVCDQRYGPDDMERVLTYIERYLRGKH